ncbi:uncharacterized protein Pyn_09281 [Prunus yedoensis var. nudiflora]|uniref:Uncharacterized protein n=1 Tax=Prunus yedoensis var. nudiflora TaxID=2094558 RepID=A0A314Z8M3_PRUYE|nr:uncharacterized protein Pyn_09281 [Prunus yedoensis var. nudiflora]
MMTFLTLRPWMRRNAFDEDGRVWYEDFISTRFIRPVEEAVWGALKNEDWDPLPPKIGREKRASAVLSRPSAPVTAVSRMSAPPTAGVTAVTSTATPSSRAMAVVRARKTLAHRIVPSPPSVRPSAAVDNTEAAAVKATTAESVAVEAEASERPRKRVLLVLSEGEDEEEAPPMTGEVAVEKATTAEVEDMLVAEAAVPATEAAGADTPDDEAITVEPTLATLVGPPPVVSAVPTLTVTASAEILSVIPRRPSGIVIPSEPATLDDLAELYASLHEEGCSSVSDPLDEDSKAVVERLREFLFLGVHQMTTAEAFMEFRSCLDWVCWIRLSWMSYRLAWPRARR